MTAARRSAHDRAAAAADDPSSPTRSRETLNGSPRVATTSDATAGSDAASRGASRGSGSATRLPRPPAGPRLLGNRRSHGAAVVGNGAAAPRPVLCYPGPRQRAPRRADDVLPPGRHCRAVPRSMPESRRDLVGSRPAAPLPGMVSSPAWQPRLPPLHIGPHQACTREPSGPHVRSRHQRTRNPSGSSSPSVARDLMLLGVVASKASAPFGIPALLVFLFVGMLGGSGGGRHGVRPRRHGPGGRGGLHSGARPAPLATPGAHHGGRHPPCRQLCTGRVPGQPSGMRWSAL